MVYGGAINYFMGFTNRTDQQEGNGIDGAHLRTPELICPEQIIINGFHFPYPLIGTNKCTMSGGL